MIRPNRTNLKIVSSLTDAGGVSSKLRALDLSASEIPPTFTQWIDQNKLTAVMDQQLCGSCWAMSSTTVLADRFIIAKNIVNLQLDPLITVACVGNDEGCNGGLPADAGKFFETNGVGVASTGCPSWNQMCESDKCQNPPECSTLSGCQTIYRAVKGSTASLAVSNSDGSVDAALTITSIQAEIMKNGSVVCATYVPFAMYDPSYWPETNGVLITGHSFYDTRLKQKFAGQTLQGAAVDAKDFSWDSIISEDGQPAGHAMTIVGWDHMTIPLLNADVPYWIIRNSWGTSWGSSGYFKYAMYNQPLNINLTLGLDVPIKSPDGLFGGCTVFDADITTGDPSGTVHSSVGINWKLILWIVAGIVIAVVLIYLIYRYRSKLPRLEPPTPQPPVVQRAPPATESKPFKFKWPKISMPDIRWPSFGTSKPPATGLV